jgi:hypothetical protein
MCLHDYRTPRCAYIRDGRTLPGAGLGCTIIDSEWSGVLGDWYIYTILEGKAQRFSCHTRSLEAQSLFDISHPILCKSKVKGVYRACRRYLSRASEFISASLRDQSIDHALSLTVIVADHKSGSVVLNLTLQCRICSHRIPDCFCLKEVPEKGAMKVGAASSEMYVESWLKVEKLVSLV